MDVIFSGALGAALLVAAGSVNGEGSGAAILKGLEKAESRQLRNKDIEELTDITSETRTGDSEKLLSRSFFCYKADLQRQITVEYPGLETGYSCRVLYKTEKGLETPWNARNDTDYCAYRAEELVKKHRKMGWKCDVAE